MIKMILVLAFVAALQLPNISSAQSRKSIKDSTTVIIFNQSASRTKSNIKSGEDNIIKIAPLGFVSGTFPILYERRVTDFFSVQLSGGLTNKNYFRTAMAKDADGIKYTYPDTWDENNTNDVSEHIYEFNYRKVQMGYMFGVQPRVYFDSDGLEGSFLGLSLDLYRYNFQIPGIVNDANNGNKQNGAMQSEHENFKDYMVHFGNQALNDRITLEYTAALGIRNVSGTKYVANGNSVNNLEGMATYKQTLFNYNLGLKVGYHF